MKDNRVVDPAEAPKVDIYADLKSPATRMAALFAQRPEGQVYGGTVPEHVVAARRAKNKRARQARRAARKLAR